MEVPIPGIHGAEGWEKGKGVIVRWGLKEARANNPGKASVNLKNFEYDPLYYFFPGRGPPRGLTLPLTPSLFPWGGKGEGVLVLCPRNIRSRINKCLRPAFLDIMGKHISIKFNV